MKNYLKTTLVALLFAGAFVSCDDDTDTGLPETAYATQSYDFGKIKANGDYAFTFADSIPGDNIDDKWTVFTEAGSKSWFINDFGGNVYIEFSSFNSGNTSNIGWVITPALNVDETKLKRMTFQSAMHHATSLDNKFEVLVSSNFDGTNVLTADWEKKSFRVPPYLGYGGVNYTFVNSGAIDLSDYSGEIYVAFRVKGNTSAQAGGFQIDNIKLF